MECSCSTSCDTCSCGLTQCGPMRGQCWLTSDQWEAREVVRDGWWQTLWRHTESIIIILTDKVWCLGPVVMGTHCTDSSWRPSSKWQRGCWWLYWAWSRSLFFIWSLLTNERPCKGDAWPIRGQYCVMTHQPRRQVLSPPFVLISLSCVLWLWPMLTWTKQLLLTSYLHCHKTRVNKNTTTLIISLISRSS